MTSDEDKRHNEVTKKVEDIEQKCVALAKIAAVAHFHIVSPNVHAEFGIYRLSKDIRLVVREGEAGGYTEWKPVIDASLEMRREFLRCSEKFVAELLQRVENAQSEHSTLISLGDSALRMLARRERGE